MAKGLTALCCGLLVIAGCGRRQDARPNLILVTFDTTRADHLSSYGYRELRTPAIDRVAAEGTLFENAIAHVPLTAPSMASLMTSTYPFVNGVRTTGFESLPLSARTISEVVKGHGYQTAAFIGSFSLDRIFGLDQGFDVYDDQAMTRALERAPASPAATAGTSPTPDLSTWKGAQAFLTKRIHADAERPAEEVTRSTLAWLGRRPSGPFFLWVHYFDPHLPHQAPKHLVDEVAAHRAPLPSDWTKAAEPWFRAGYDAELLYMDFAFAKLLDGLQEMKLLDRSLLVLHADHGEETGRRALVVGHGPNLFDDTARVPLVLRGAGWPAGRRIAPPVRLLDVAPTILDSLGMPREPGFQGRSLRPLLEQGEGAPVQPAYLETHFQLQFPPPAAAAGQAPTGRWKRGLRTDRHKLVVTYAAMPYGETRSSTAGDGTDHDPGTPVDTELYDLRQDPGEERNIAAEHGEVVARMQDEIVRLIKSSGRGARSRADGVNLTDEEREKLRSLGYVR